MVPQRKTTFLLLKWEASVTSNNTSGNVENITSTNGDITISGNLEITGTANLSGLLFQPQQVQQIQVLVSDGTGNLSWANQLGGTGSD